MNNNLRVLSLDMIDNSFIKGYDVVCFSFDSNAVPIIIKEDYLKNIMKKQIIEIRYNNIKAKDVKLGSFDNIYAIWNKHSKFADTVDEAIDFMNIINLCRLNKFKNILIVINDNYKFIRFFYYLANFYELKIDIIVIYTKNE